MNRLVIAGLILWPAFLGAAEPKEDDKPVLVPYRLTATNHVLVRAKVNGKGPFHFILDTGAPALFVTTKVANKAGVQVAKRGLSTVDRFEVEGGVVFEKAKGRVEDIFQIEGMNGMGLAGVELHGVIGYNLLAKYRIEYDFTRDKLPWTALKFEPPALALGMGGKSAPGGLEMIGSMMKFLGPLLGMKSNFAVEPRGFFGAECIDDSGTVRVSRVLEGGPADKAGIKVGDELRKLGTYEVEFAREVPKKLAKHAVGETLKTVLRRDGKEITLTLELGKGL
ncbi:MAG: PDZ domain-containing protein [Gemmataceae bacterium]